MSAGSIDVGCEVDYKRRGKGFLDHEDGAVKIKFYDEPEIRMKKELGYLFRLEGGKANAISLASEDNKSAPPVAPIEQGCEVEYQRRGKVTFDHGDCAGMVL